MICDWLPPMVEPWALGLYDCNTSTNVVGGSRYVVCVE